MPDCVVIGCTSSSKRVGGQKDVSFHVFPKTHEKIKLWLQQTNQYTGDQMEIMVQRIFDTNKNLRYRMCSKHFHPDCYYTHGVNKKLKPDAAPTIFPSRLTHYSQTPSTDKPDASGSALTFQESPSTSTTAFLLEKRSRIPRCHACGQKCNIITTESSTNTENIIHQDSSTQFDNFHCTLSSSVQTYKIIPTFSKGTSTRDYLKKKDQYTWTMGDISNDNTIEGSIAFRSAEMMAEGIETNLLQNPVLQVDIENDNVPQIISNPIADIIPASEVSEISFISLNSENDDNAMIEDQDTGSKDPTYLPETTEETMDEFSIQEEVNNSVFVEEKKYIVFERCLDELLKLIPCRFKNNCESPMMSTQKRLVGTMLIVTGECESGHNSALWYSQPTIGQRPVGNILACSSLLFTGNQFEKINDYFTYFGIPFLSKQTFYNYQKTFLFPTVDIFWKEECSKNLETFKGRGIAITGDGQCDSPGFSAKYCTYTTMEAKTKKKLNLEIIQVTETTSSVAMEAKGFRRAMNQMISKGLMPVMVATDRHVSIRKILREEYKNINHQFDIWHYTKSLKKKIITVSRKKNCSELSKWVLSIANHLWSCSVSCEGDVEKMEKLWKSCLYHVLNIHSWIDNGVEWTCGHGELQKDEERKRKWLTKQSEAFHELEKIVLNDQIIKDLRHLNFFCHTGKLEVFHSLVLKYRPKRIHFRMDAMEARTKLAALANNMNTHRVQSKVKHPTSRSGSYGELQFDTYFPKSKKEWMVRPVYDDMDLSYIHKMSTEVLNLVEGTSTHSWESKNMLLPPNIASTPRPDKKLLIEKHTSRFGQRKL